MSRHQEVIAAGMMVLILVAGCREPEPTDTLAPAVEEKPDGDVGSITVPSADPATLDGKLSPGEWDNAIVEQFTDGSELLLMQAGGYLYLGIRSITPEMIVGNIFVHHGDEIAIHHTSAALGTAVYRQNGDSWQQIQDFTWQVRDSSLSDAARAERDRFLEEEGWVATNSRMGTPQELEYKIELTGDTTLMAANILRSSNPDKKIPWPANLDDDVIKPTPGGYPETFHFSPDRWGTLAVSVGGTTETPAMTPTSLPGASGRSQAIAFTSERDGNWEIYLMATAEGPDGEGSDPIRLTDSPGEDYWPTWSADGSQIAFASERDGNYEIYIIDAGGSNPRRLTHESADDLEPDWSPDGAMIAFMVYEGGQSDVYIMNVDGSERRRLTEGNGDNYLPEWSPDGTQIVFVSDRDGNPEIYIMQGDGSDQRRLTDSLGDDLYPSWSPDGARIAFYSGRDGGRELYVMDVDGGNARPLTQDNAQVWVSDWSADGRQIVFTSNRDGNREIYVIDVEGGNLQRLTNNDLFDGIPAWRP